jgi:site-specific DNA-methyltransferase (adenine-specific)
MKKDNKQKDSNGKCELIEQKSGVPMSDVWGIPYLNPKAKERIGYPTQKPILLLQHIIEIASDEGTIVLDPFCGSGTTLVAAKLLKRKYIGIDQLPEAIELSKQRLNKPIKTESMLLKNGRQAYKNQKGIILDILKKIDAQPVQRNKGIDGFLKIDGKMKPIPVRIQRNTETFEYAKNQLRNAIAKNEFPIAILYKTVNGINTELFSMPQTNKNKFYVFDKIDDIVKFKKDFSTL